MPEEINQVHAFRKNLNEGYFCTLCGLKEEAEIHFKDNPTPSYYNFDFRGVKMDPYRVILVYKITHPSHQHALKKILRAGQSEKTLEQDIQETIDALRRWQEMLKEDSET